MTGELVQSLFGISGLIGMRCSRPPPHLLYGITQKVDSGDELNELITRIDHKQVLCCVAFRRPFCS